MELRILLLLSAFGVSAIQACHHRKEQFPPDNFPEDGDGLPNKRKRRNVHDDDGLYTIFPPILPTVEPQDGPKELSDFFTTCMRDKTGSFFPSWRSVLDFIFRDARWFSATDEQYCEENEAQDPNSVKCWQNRLDYLLQPNSKLLAKGKECVEEYIWSKKEENFIIRGKRQVPSRPNSGFDTCLGVSNLQYSQCVQGELITPQNMRVYPSLRDWDQKSVNEFISDHYTSCRITSRYTGGRNVYRESCPSNFRNPLFPRPKPTCMSSQYNEIVRTSSPLYSATKTCIEKYSDDKCKNVRCTRAHQRCDQQTGRCVCDVGYEEDWKGDCVPENKCILVFCGGQHETCDPTTGQCVCQSGYTRAQNGVCTILDPCSLVFCGGRNEVCDRNTGQCVCRPGYVRDRNEICRRQVGDPCRGHTCGINEQCVNSQGRALCICLPGFKRLTLGVCTFDDPCSDVNCGLHGECKATNGVGVCECDLGYRLQDGVCTLIDPCDSHRCGRNMRCVVNRITGRPQCECRPGFVPARGGNGCVRPDPCDGVRCPPNSRCIRGNCVCNQGFEKNDIGNCVPIDPCATVRCAQNMECIVSSMGRRAQCQCLPRFVPVVDGVGCRLPDPCDGVRCPPDSQCVLGDCVCDKGFEKDQNGRCVRPNPCENFCTVNEICVVVEGRPECKCAEGFTLNLFGECLDSDPCDGVKCERNMECQGGTCFCLPGFIKARVGCQRRNPCENVNCPPDRTCVAGQCVCKPEFTQTADGNCRPRNPCDGVTCAANMQCRNGNCVCLPGFVPNPVGEGCRRSRGRWGPWSIWRDCSQSCDGGTQMRFRQCEGGASCAGDPIGSRPCNTQDCKVIEDDACLVPVPVRCPANSRCVDGTCVCNPNTHRLQDGRCISCPPDKIFNECPTSCFGRCGSASSPSNASMCITACRPNVYCVCPEGMIELSATDSTCVSPPDCPAYWSRWGRWMECSRTCGGGVQLRRRRCRGTGCQGGATETRPCNQQACRPGGRCVSPKVYQRCPTRCPKNCGNHGVEILCDSGCRNDTNCVCPDGMVERSRRDSSCVDPSECPGLCFPNPCKHGGKCIAIGATYRCRCESGYSGKNCEIGCGKYCNPNGRCIRGNCVCNRGFVSDGKGGCRRPVPQ